MKGRVVKVQAEEPNLIHMELRLASGQKEKVTVEGFKPRFYVLGEGDFVNPFGERLREVEYGNFSRTEALRERYDGLHQDDIPFRRVFLIEKEIKSGVEINDSEIENGKVNHENIKSWDASEISPRFCFLDIEVIPGKGEESLNTKEASQPVVAVTLYDSYSNNFMMLVRDHSEAPDISEPEGILKNKDNFDSDSNVLIFEKEDELLEAVARFFGKVKPDVVIGWNIDYDIDYLNSRFPEREFDFAIDVERFDLMSAYEQTKRLNYHPSLKEIVFKEGIVERRPKTGMQVLTEYEKNGNIEDLIDYNFDDVDWLVQLDEMYDMTGRFTSQKDMVGLEGYQQTFLRAVPIETGLMRLVDDVILPSQPKDDIYERRKEKKRKKYSIIENRGGKIGARVTEPPAEIIENVAVFDFSQYYPSIIVGFNLSPELEIDLPSEYDVDLEGYEDTEIPKVDGDGQGLLPLLCEEWFEQRERVDKKIHEAEPGTEKYKRLQQEKDSVKTYVNAIYGYAGHERARLYDEDVVIKVGLVGREGIKIIEDVAEEEGYRDIFSDTDGVHVQVPFEEAKELGEKMEKEVNKRLKKKFNLEEEPGIMLDFEKFYERIIFTGAKKRYCGLVKWEDGKETDYLDIKHFEAIKTDSSLYAKLIQKHLLEKIVRGADVNELQDWFESVHEKFEDIPIYKCIECERRFPLGLEQCESCGGDVEKIREGNYEDLAYRKGIRKKLSDYESPPRQAKAALVSNTYLGTNFRKGSKPQILLVDNVSNVGEEVDAIAFESDVPEVKIDWSEEKRINLYDKVDEILNIAGVNFKKWKMSAEGQKFLDF